MVQGALKMGGWFKSPHRPLDMLNPVKLHCKFTVRGTGPDIFKLVHYEAHAECSLECSLLDAADAHTRMSNNKTYLANDESTFMLERRKQEQRHFLDQSVFIFEVKVYKLVRWCTHSIQHPSELPLQLLESKQSFRQDAISLCFTVGASLCDYKSRLLSRDGKESFQRW